MLHPLCVFLDRRAITLDVPFGTPALAAVSGATDGNARAAVVRIDDLAHRDTHAVARVGDRRENLAFARIGKRMEARERTGVIEVGVHVRVEDDLDRLGGGKTGKQADEYRYGTHDAVILSFRRA